MFSSLCQGISRAVAPQGSVGSSAALMHLQEGSAGDLGSWMGFRVLEAKFPFPHSAGKGLGAAWCPAGLEVEISLL